jgi:hypothetical protein
MSNNQRPKCETISLEEATVSNMWEIAAVVEELERKSLCTKQDLYDIITESRPSVRDVPASVRGDCVVHF